MFTDISKEIKYSIYFHFDFLMFDLKKKYMARPDGNRHMWITLHAISMLDLCHLVILIYVTIDEFSYDINVTKIALVLY